MAFLIFLDFFSRAPDSAQVWLQAMEYSLDLYSDRLIPTGERENSKIYPNVLEIHFRISWRKSGYKGCISN